MGVIRVAERVLLFQWCAPPFVDQARLLRKTRKTAVSEISAFPTNGKVGDSCFLVVPLLLRPKGLPHRARIAATHILRWYPLLRLLYLQTAVHIVRDPFCNGCIFVHLRNAAKKKKKKKKLHGRKRFKTTDDRHLS